MPTSKKRINITIDDETYAALERLSIKREQSVSGVGLSLSRQIIRLHHGSIGVTSVPGEETTFTLKF